VIGKIIGGQKFVIASEVWSFGLLLAENSNLKRNLKNAEIRKKKFVKFDV